MKIEYDHTIPAPSEEEMDDVFERSRSIEDASPEELALLREEMSKVKRVVIPDHVMEQLQESGMTPDEVVALLLSKLGMTQ